MAVCYVIPCVSGAKVIQVRPILSATLFLVFLLPAPLFAGGFTHPSNGTAALARGGAFTVLANDLVALEFNPGGLAKLPGSHIYIGNNTTLYNITFTGLDIAGNPVEPVSNEGGPMWAAPFIGGATDFGLKNWRFALGVYGPSANGISSFPVDEFPTDDQGGTPYCLDGASWDQPSLCRPHHYMMLDYSVVLAFYTLGIAYGDPGRWGVGLSLHYVDLIEARFKMFANSFWLSADTASEKHDVEATIKVSDRFSWAATLGGWFRPADNLEVGASLRGPTVNFDGKGKTELDFKGSLISTLYEEGVKSKGEQGLVAFDANGNQTTSIPTTFKFSYPATVRAGVRYLHEIREGDDARELFDVEFDFVWEGWSVLDKYAIDLEGYMMLMGAQAPEKLLFYSLDVTRNYEDTFSFRLGGQVSPVPGLTVRAGTYYETGAVPHSLTNIDFASFDRIGVATGVSYKLSLLTLSLAYSHIIQPDRKVAHDESEVYKYFPALEKQVSDQKFQVGAGTYETSYDIFSLAVAMDF